MLVDRSLSTSSSTPVTVTVWAVSQVVVVNSSEDLSTVATLVSPLATATVTVPVGLLSSTTV